MLPRWPSSVSSPHTAPCCLNPILLQHTLKCGPLTLKFHEVRLRCILAALRLPELITAIVDNA